MKPLKKQCKSVSPDGQECGLVDPPREGVMNKLLDSGKSSGDEIKKSLLNDEIWEKRSFFGKSASKDWKQPANYRDTLDETAPVAEAAEQFEITSGGKRKTRRRRHSVRKSRKYARKSRKQRKTRRR